MRRGLGALAAVAAVFLVAASLTIDVPLPKPLRKLLDGLSRKSSLKAKLSVGLDNAAAFGQTPAKELTVKLPGRRTPAPHRR